MEEATKKAFQLDVGRSVGGNQKSVRARTGLRILGGNSGTGRAQSDELRTAHRSEGEPVPKDKWPGVCLSLSTLVQIIFAR